MKNVIFIHAANMAIDKRGRPSLGRCQQILDRMAEFIQDSKIYEIVDAIHLHYTGEEGLKLDLPKTTITYHGENVYQWEFPTLKHLRDYCKDNPEDNVLYLHTQGISDGFKHVEGEHIDLRIEQRRDYHMYWNVTKYKQCLEILKEYDTCGAMLVPLNADLTLDSEGNPHIIKLHGTPVWHYSQNFWWSRASHVNTLPHPENYPLILDVRHQAEFWLCSSTENGTHGCIHKLYESWCYATNFAPERYMDVEDLIRLVPSYRAKLPQKL